MTRGVILELKNVFLSNVRTDFLCELEQIDLI